MRTTFSDLRSDKSAHTRKLTLKKETLRQLTGAELQMVAGGVSTVSTASASLSPSTKITPSTSVVMPSTSVAISGH